MTEEKFSNMRNRRPYAGIDWSRAEQIQGTTHVHCTETEEFEALISKYTNESD